LKFKAKFLPLLLLIILISTSGCRWTKNFYEVDPGKFYRSAQLTKEEFQQVIETHGIKTILNLQGPHDEQWFYDEVEVAKKNNVRLVNIPMNALRLPHRDHILRLMHTLEKAERPILVHCQSGSDRTGEASVLYQMEYMGKTKEEALNNQLGIKYLHFRLFTPAKKYFIDLYQGPEWVKQKYDPCFDPYPYYYDPLPIFCPKERHIPAPGTAFEDLIGPEDRIQN
jgi:protein tyrosine phosphatase (PTP) superfamily phosphohydrolase (DUF442 family)